MKENNVDQYYLSPSVFLRCYQDWAVVYQTEEQMIYTFNATAAEILNGFRESTSPNDVINKLCSIYDIEDRDSIKAEVESFTTQLLDKKILKKKQQQVVNVNNLESEVFAQFSEGEQLFSATIELTYRCNEKCRHCYISDENKSEMSYEKIVSILDELADMGTFNLIFTGGEIFVRKDAFDILEYAYSKNFLMDIFTNGTLLDGNDYIRLKCLWPRCVHFSLYSHIPEKHDAVTQVKGSFEKTLHSIKTCVQIGIPVNIKTPIFEETMEDTVGIIQLANDIGCTVELGRNITPRKNGDLSPLKMKIQSEDNEKKVVETIYELISTLDNEPERIGHSNKLCGAGDRSISINPYGEVFPCNMLQICIGDVYQDSIQGIWNNSDKLSWWRKSNKKSLKKGCENCQYIEQCIFCPGEAMMRNGDPLNMYEEACKTTKFAIEREREGGESHEPENEKRIRKADNN